MKGKNFSVKNICTIGLFVAIISVLSWITIPMPFGVPMTLQTLAVPLAGMILGHKKGTLAAAVYVLLGAAGVPVFAGFTSGAGSLLGLTGGFIWAFPLMALVVGLGARKGNASGIIIGLLFGILVDYTAGTLQYMVLSGSSLKAGVMACVLPFLPTEAIKAVFVGTVGARCRLALRKSGLITA